VPGTADASGLFTMASNFILCVWLVEAEGNTCGRAAGKHAAVEACATWRLTAISSLVAFVRPNGICLIQRRIQNGDTQHTVTTCTRQGKQSSSPSERDELLQRLLRAVHVQRGTQCKVQRRRIEEQVGGLEGDLQVRWQPLRHVRRDLAGAAGR
jgi:hypothetical protein